jgi:hypothetical protein
MEAALSSAPAPLLFMDDNKRIDKSFLKRKTCVIVFPVAELSPHGWRGCGAEKWGGGMRVKVFAYNPRRELRRTGNFLFESGVTL